MNLFTFGAKTNRPTAVQAAIDQAQYDLSKLEIEAFASLVTYLASTGFEDVAALNEYFAQFVAIPKNDKGEDVCLGCDKPFYSDGLMNALLGGSPARASWEWSLAHGECHCSNCGYPARAYHYDIGGANGTEPLIKRLNVTLPVHPSGLVVREPEPEPV
jgi:hypothetical protein